MKALRFITCLVLALSANAMAQTYQQKGMVRMITTSASSPLTPVAGVKVQVGNNLSKATGSNGAFAMQVTRQFQVNGVVPSDEYLLALPTKGKAYNQSENDLDVVVTTKTKKEADYKRLYKQMKEKYDAQADELMTLKQEYKSRLQHLEATDQNYDKLKAKLDSVQHLYLDYINNEEKIDKEIRDIADELSITDYQTLDSINRRIYDLKCAGEWKSISDMLDEIMHGDAEGFLKEGIDNQHKAEETLRRAKEEDEEAEDMLNKRLGIIEDATKKQK